MLSNTIFLSWKWSFLESIELKDNLEDNFENKQMACELSTVFRKNILATSSFLLKITCILMSFFRVINPRQSFNKGDLVQWYSIDGTAGQYCNALNYI